MRYDWDKQDAALRAEGKPLVGRDELTLGDGILDTSNLGGKRRGTKEECRAGHGTSSYQKKGSAVIHVKGHRTWIAL